MFDSMCLVRLGYDFVNFVISQFISLILHICIEEDLEVEIYICRKEKRKMTQKGNMFKGQQNKKSIPPNRHGKITHTRKGNTVV